MILGKEIISAAVQGGVKLFQNLAVRPPKYQYAYYQEWEEKAACNRHKSVVSLVYSGNNSREAEGQLAAFKDFDRVAIKIASPNRNLKFIANVRVAERF